eukprot:XP_017945764.1 PREDICTED: hepatitis A virus cellular receptor 1 homolog [Xenopus tropicalis]
MGRSGNWGVISLRICLFLWLQPALSVSGPVIGSEGGRVLLPCTYSVTKGTITMCWGRGSCPASKCNNQIIRTDGREVTWKASERYGLMGSLTQGNVSLTITGLTGSDSGTYCCRVETPGWFNDQKVVVSLEVHEAASEDSTAFATTSSLTNMALERVYTWKQDGQRRRSEGGSVRPTPPGRSGRHNGRTWRQQKRTPGVLETLAPFRKCSIYHHSS